MEPPLLTRAWDASGGMGDDEDDGCCCCCCGCGCGGEEAGSRRHHALSRLLRDKETRLQRMARFLAAAFLLLATAAVALLVTAVLEGRVHAAPDNQALKQTDGTAAGAGVEEHQPKDFTYPSVLLTAPDVIDIKGQYLNWESERGNAFCLGGFSYANGNLVVPRKGVYRVFLQITFQGDTDDGRTEPVLITNTVYIIKDSYNETVPFLSSVDTVSCSKERWCKSLFTAGSFSLEDDSRLLVTSSHPELISRNEHMTFFGAELLHQ